MKFRKKTYNPENDRSLLSLEMSLEDGTPLMMFPADVIESLRHAISRLVSKKTLPARLSLVAALHQEGVTYLSRALALTLANDLDTPVCAVELNWWWPDKTIPLPVGSPGLAGVLSGEIKLKEAIVRTSQPNLSIIPAGKLAVPDRPTYARSTHLKEILYQLNEQYEYLILDVPAVSVTNDSIPLASLGAACCLVIHQGVTPIEKVKSALDEIDHQKFLGVILNKTRVKTPSFLVNLIPQDFTAETSLVSG